MDYTTSTRNRQRECRERARELRAQGWSFQRIADEVGVCRETARNWTGDIAVEGYRRRPGRPAKTQERERARELRLRASPTTRSLGRSRFLPGRCPPGCATCPSQSDDGRGTPAGARYRYDPEERERLWEAAVALRREGHSVTQISAELYVPEGTLDDWLFGIPPPEWTKRPNAKDEEREKAREMRLAGHTYDEIVAALGVSKSSVSLWVRDLPKPKTRRKSSYDYEGHGQRIRELYWEPELVRREVEREQTKQAAAREIGELSDRELLIAGVVLYWAEGGKDKPHRRRERVDFINSDPDVIRLFLRWLDVLGVDRERLRYHLSSHETADVDKSVRFWAGIVGEDPSRFGKTWLKRHNPKTQRKNVGNTYHGCLVVRMVEGAGLYQRIEGWWRAIAGKRCYS